MKEQQLLRNPDTEPSEELIAEGLGPAASVYSRFAEELKNHDVQLDWRYYNDGKAWLGKGLYRWISVRGRQKEMTVFWLSVWKEYFKVTFYISEKYRMETLNLPLDCGTLKMAENAEQMGKLKFFPLVFDIHSDQMLDQVSVLIEFKKGLK